MPSLRQLKYMELKEYPTAIAKLQIEIHGFDLEVSQLQKNIKLIESEVEEKVAFDSTLTNDTKRKTKRLALLEKHCSYWEYRVKLEGFKNQREFGLIELDRLRGEFSVAKLETRERIARLETAL
jgi:hypothetical protein